MVFHALFVCIKINTKIVSATPVANAVAGSAGDKLRLALNLFLLYGLPEAPSVVGGSFSHSKGRISLVSGTQNGLYPRLRLQCPPYWAPLCLKPYLHYVFGQWYFRLNVSLPRNLAGSTELGTFNSDNFYRDSTLKMGSG